MGGCSAVGCRNRREHGYIMKVFPRDPKRRKEWAAKVNRPNWKPTDNSHLCEIHFEPEMWEKTRVDGKRKLKCNAVPTLFTFMYPEVERKSPMKRTLTSLKGIKYTFVPSITSTHILSETTKGMKENYQNTGIVYTKKEHEVDPNQYTTSNEKVNLSVNSANYKVKIEYEDNFVERNKVEKANECFEGAQEYKEEIVSTVVEAKQNKDIEFVNVDSAPMLQECSCNMSNCVFKRRRSSSTQCSEKENSVVDNKESKDGTGSEPPICVKEEIVEVCIEEQQIKCESFGEHFKVKNEDSEELNICNANGSDSCDNVSLQESTANVEVKIEPLHHSNDADSNDHNDKTVFENLLLPEHFVEWSHRKTEGGRLQCLICAKTCKRMCDLRRHLQVHENRSRPKCTFCGKIFRSNYQVMKHARIHTGERPFVCDICGSAFKTKSYLKTHAMRVHDETGKANVEENLKCVECGKAFWDNYSLLVHERSHTNVRPFVCELCCKGFKEKSKLKRHLLDVHKI